MQPTAMITVEGKAETDSERRDHQQEDRPDERKPCQPAAEE